MEKLTTTTGDINQAIQSWVQNAHTVISNIAKDTISNKAESNEHHIHEYLKEAETYLVQNQFDEAENICTKAVFILHSDRLINKELLSNYTNLAKCFVKLGDIYFKRISLSAISENDDKYNTIGDYFRKAILFYNAALTISNKKNIEIDNNIYQHIIEIEYEFLTKVYNRKFSYPSSIEKIKNYRETWRNKVLNITEHEMETAVDVRILAQSCSNNIKSFLIGLIDECLIILDPPPCRYAFLSFGSLAKQSATPYSDIEFGILVDDDKPGNIKYFKVLSHLLNARVMHIGQTVIPNNLLQNEMNIPLELDDILFPGFQFDLGGKTPLGRPDKPYNLITTPIKMAKYVKDEYFKIDKFLPIEISSYAYLYGNEKLLKPFKEKVDETLSLGREYNHNNNGKARAIKILHEGYVGIQSDLEKYAPLLESIVHEGKLYNIKPDIYRLPDRLLEGIRLFYGYEESNSWEIINALSEEKLINPKAKENLSKLCAIAYKLRLNTYLANQGQRENRLIFAPIPSQDESEIDSFIGESFHANDINELYEFYYIAQPFHNFLYDITFAYINNEKLPNMVEINFYDNSLMMQGLIHKRFLKYRKAHECFDQIKDNLPAKIYTADMLFLMNRYSDALEKYLAVYDNFEDGKSPNFIDISALERRIANAYARLLNYDKAEKFCLNSKDRLEDLIQQHSPIPNSQQQILYPLAICYDFLGVIYEGKNNFDEAKKYYQFSVDKLKEGSTDYAKHEMAESLMHLGNINQRLGNYEGAKDNLQKAIKILRKFYGAQPNLYVAECVKSLGFIALKLGYSKDAINCFNQVYYIYDVIFENSLHPHKLSVINSMAAALEALGKYDEALVMMENIASISQSILEKNPTLFENNSLIFLNIIHNLGKLYMKKGEYLKAESIFSTSVTGYRTIFLNDQSEEIANCLHNLAICYMKLNRIDEALNHYVEALKIQLHIYAKQPCHYLIECLNDLGCLLLQLSDPATEDCYIIVLQLCEKIYEKNENHPNKIFANEKLDEYNQKIRKPVYTDSHSSLFEIIPSRLMPNHDPKHKKYIEIIDGYLKNIKKMYQLKLCDFSEDESSENSDESNSQSSDSNDNFSGETKQRIRYGKD